MTSGRRSGARASAWYDPPRPRDWYSRTSRQDLHDFTLPKAFIDAPKRFKISPPETRGSTSDSYQSIYRSESIPGSGLSNLSSSSNSSAPSRDDSGIHESTSLLFQNSQFKKDDSSRWNESVRSKFGINKQKNLSKYKILPSIHPSRPNTSSSNKSRSLSSIGSAGSSVASIPNYKRQGKEMISSKLDRKFIGSAIKMCASSNIELNVTEPIIQTSINTLIDTPSSSLQDLRISDPQPEKRLFRHITEDDMDENEDFDSENSESDKGNEDGDTLGSDEEGEKKVWVNVTNKPLPLVRSRTFEVIETNIDNLPVIEDDLVESTVHNTEEDTNTESTNEESELESKVNENELSTDVNDVVTDIISETVTNLGQDSETESGRKSPILMEVSIDGLPLNQFLSLAKDGLIKPKSELENETTVDPYVESSSPLNFTSSFRIRSSTFSGIPQLTSSPNIENDNAESVKDTSPINSPISEGVETKENEDIGSTYSISSMGSFAQNVYDIDRNEDHSLLVNYDTRDNTIDFLDSFDLQSENSFPDRFKEDADSDDFASSFDFDKLRSANFNPNSGSCSNLLLDEDDEIVFGALRNDSSMNEYDDNVDTGEEKVNEFDKDQIPNEDAKTTSLENPESSLTSSFIKDSSIVGEDILSHKDGNMIVLYVKFPDETVSVVSTKSKKTLNQLLDRFRTLSWRGKVVDVKDESVDRRDLEKTLDQLGIHDCSTIYLIS